MNREGNGLKHKLCHYFTKDDLVICFLSCSFWMHRITQKFLCFFVAKRSFFALCLSRWGGGGKCDQIAKHLENGQNLIYMHLAHNWLLRGLQPLSTVVPFARSMMFTGVGQPSRNTLMNKSLPVGSLLPSLPISIYREPWKRPCPGCVALPVCSQGGWRGTYLGVRF